MILLFGALCGLLAISACIVVMIAAATGVSPVPLPAWPWAQGEQRVAGAKPPLPPEIAPPSDPAALRPISRTDAVTENAAIPLSTAPNPAAGRFLIGGRDVGNWARSLDCLTAAVYYEAASEGQDGMRAVAQVVLNRVRHPAYPHSVCGVVFQGSERKTGCQFTFTCDGSLARIPSRTGWAQAQGVANAALAGTVYRPVGWSTHYHTDWVVPYWASSLVKTAVVGTHIFYRWTGGWGQPGAFTARYSGTEPVVDWRGDASQTEAIAEAPIAASPVPLEGGKALPSIADRPVLAASAPAPEQKAGSAEGAGARGYVLAERRWVLGGVGGDNAASARSEPRVTAPAPAATQERDAQ